MIYTRFGVPVRVIGKVDDSHVLVREIARKGQRPSWSGPRLIGELKADGGILEIDQAIKAALEKKARAKYGRA